MLYNRELGDSSKQTVLAFSSVDPPRGNPTLFQLHAVHVHACAVTPTVVSWWGDLEGKPVCNVIAKTAQLLGVCLARHRLT